MFERLKAFPYYQNYFDLTRLELAALYAITSPDDSIRNIAFIGSGPLPLSSLCLRDALNSKDSPFGLPPSQIAPLLDLDANEDELQKSENHVTLMNIDRDAEALELSRRLCQGLGVRGEGMEFWCGDLGDATVSEDVKKQGLQEYDAVFLAALVGENQEAKERMIQKITSQMKEGSILVVRSAQGLRVLLYPVSFLSSLDRGRGMEEMMESSGN